MAVDKVTCALCGFDESHVHYDAECIHRLFKQNAALREAVKRLRMACELSLSHSGGVWNGGRPNPAMQYLADALEGTAKYVKEGE